MTILDRLRELETQATKAPWDATPVTNGLSSYMLTEADGLLVVAMRNALPALLAVAEAAIAYLAANGNLDRSDDRAEQHAAENADLRAFNALADAVDAVTGMEGK